MEQLVSKMNQLRLQGMARSWQGMVETRRIHELSLVEGLEILLQAEEDQRDSSRFERLQRNARFRYQATIEELNYDVSRGLDKSLVHLLSTGTYLEKGVSVLITGAAGCGKSYLASALGQRACSQGNSVAYFNVQKLMLQIKMSKAEGTSIKFFQKLSKTDLLILDDFGLTNLDIQQSLSFMEIIEDRYGKCSTIISSQLPVASWYDIFAEATVADAILDRLVHSSYRIELKGESLRKKL